MNGNEITSYGHRFVIHLVNAKFFHKCKSKHNRCIVYFFNSLICITEKSNVSTKNSIYVSVNDNKSNSSSFYFTFKVF